MDTIHQFREMSEHLTDILRKFVVMCQTLTIKTAGGRWTHAASLYNGHIRDCREYLDVNVKRWVDAAVGDSFPVFQLVLEALAAVMDMVSDVTRLVATNVGHQHDHVQTTLQNVYAMYLGLVAYLSMPFPRRAAPVAPPPHPPPAAEVVPMLALPDGNDDDDDDEASPASDADADANAGA